MSERLDAIQATVDNHQKSPGGIYGPGSDVAYLLDLVKERQAALAEAWSEGAHFGGLYPVVFQNDNPYRLGAKP